MPLYHQGKKVENVWYGGRKVKNAWYGGKKVYASTIVISGSAENVQFSYTTPAETVKTVTVPDGRTTCEVSITYQHRRSSSKWVALESNLRGRLAYEDERDELLRIEGKYDVTPGEVLKIVLYGNQRENTATWEFKFS